MIRELINFTEKIDDQFKGLGTKPKEGLHILISAEYIEGNISYNFEDYTYEIYSKKQKKEISPFLEKCKLLHQNAWCIDTNKCFDLPRKAIHSCSPYCIAFKKEHLIGGAKYNENETKGVKQIYDRFAVYFGKSRELMEKEERGYLKIFEQFFSKNDFSKVIKTIEDSNREKRDSISDEINKLKEQSSEEKNKIEKNRLKELISEKEQEFLLYRELLDGDYIIFYLSLPIEKYKEVHKKYLDDKLFVTDKFNTKANEDGVIYGVSNFQNTLNGNMPFLMHQTATFDINGRVSNFDAKELYDLANLLPNKTLPNPLPIFIYEEELQQDVIGLFKDSGYKMGYQELIKELLKLHKKDISNYYLLYWHNSTKGIVFKDFDFVSKFEYEVDVEIINYFDIKEKETKKAKFYPKIQDVFQLEQSVFKALLQSKYLRLDYFNELKKDDYERKDLTFVSYSKYRKSVYDFVYKSQRQAIDGNMFDEMVFNAVKDDIKQSNSYGVKEKLNIWYSLHNFFNRNKNINMASKLKKYQEFVENIITGTVDEKEITDETFAFASGQVINYILEKSKSADNSFQLLEPYLQKSKCSELKQAIANDFARYKHENFSRRYERVAAFVLSYDTEKNIKHLLPELLSGVFSKNQLFSSNN